MMSTTLQSRGESAHPTGMAHTATLCLSVKGSLTRVDFLILSYWNKPDPISSPTSPNYSERRDTDRDPDRTESQSHLLAGRESRPVSGFYPKFYAHGSSLNAGKVAKLLEITIQTVAPSPSVGSALARLAARITRGQRRQLRTRNSN